MIMNNKWMKKVFCMGVLTVVCGSTFIGCGSKKIAEVKDFDSSAQSIENIELLEDVRIVALGEATHGNVEFQELKLEVFRQLVETTKVRGFALEGDFGGCALANQYILYDKGNAEEVVKRLGFEIYRTDQMLALVQWMHDYNLEASDENKVRFYGFDMQRNICNKELIKEFYQMIDKEKAVEYMEQLDFYYGETEQAYDKVNLPQIENLLNDIVGDLETNQATYEASNEEVYAYALQGAKCLLQNIVLQEAGNNYSQVRDKNMTENVKWILNREEKIYGTKLMISGHNGHVAKAVSSLYTNMGYYLHEEMGTEYFVIGTDFYNTTCSLPENEGRAEHKFCSDDPLAKAVGEMSENKYYLDFKMVREDTNIFKLLHETMPTGSLGESYSPVMNILKSTYQINIAPSELYDGMILVYEATPIQVWDYMQ